MFQYFQNKIWSPQTSPQLQPQDTPINVDQDENDIPYLAEVDQGGMVYRAMPVESYIHEEHPPKDVQLYFDGENKDKVVLVPGFPGYDIIEVTLPFGGGTTWTIADYWSDVRDVIEDPFVVNPNRFGSVHDRAVEIFYQIKGGQVDYGSGHSQYFGHEQMGATYEGLIPDWSPDNPIVLIGKGYGATTILHLQYLLSINFFGQQTSGKMIKGVICLSAPHRGSTLLYYLGLRPGSKCDVHPFSLLQLFLSFIHLVCYFACLERFFNFRLNDQWRLSPKSEGGEQSLRSAITGRSKFACSGDNFLFDLSVEGARQRYTGDDRHQLDSHCFYINYVTTGYSWRSKITGHYWPRLSWSNLPTAFLSSCLGQYKLDEQVLRTSSATFWPNDGTLSVYGQLPPPHQQVLMNISLDDETYDPVDHKLQPGLWYNALVEDRKNTILFNKEPFINTLPLVEDLLRSTYVKKAEGLLSTNTEIFEYYYIRGVEASEHLVMMIKNMLFLHGAGNIDEHMTDTTYSPSKSKSSSSSSSSSTSPLPYISQRIVKRSSDKAGLEWINKIETAELMNCPTKLIYLMNQMQKMQTGSENAGDEKDFGALLSQGSMFAHAKRKMTIDDYMATVITAENKS